MRRPFLTARWEHLVFLNYPCPPHLLAPLVPAGTELDPWHGETLISLIGFRFADTRLLGIPVPWHRTFEEVNLRFYVRRRMPDGSARRAVIFVRELVPRAAIAAVARWAYNEPYWSVPMSHAVSLDPERGGRARYSWRHGGAACAVEATVRGQAVPLMPGSEAEFITEHYWGYTRQRDGSTLEYEVAHPPWRVWSADTGVFEGSSAALYGDAFARILGQPPRSTFVAVGSPVTVYRPTPLATGGPR